MSVFKRYFRRCQTCSYASVYFVISDAILLSIYYISAIYYISDFISCNVSEIWNTSCPIYLEGSHPKIPSYLCHVTGIIATICFRMLVLAALKETKMAYSRDEERSLISSFNKEQRKYGSTSTYIKKPERFISYEVQPGDTLQGISLKHNVTVRCCVRDAVFLQYGTLSY